MKVSFDGKLFDPDTQEAELRDACRLRAKSMVRKLEEAALVPALEELLASASLIAVKLGATAALHHAYSVPVDNDLIDVFAHTLNKLVGLNYVPPERIVTNPSQEPDSGNEESTEA